jgi:uncharacterized protein with HEPN domain
MTRKGGKDRRTEIDACLKDIRDSADAVAEYVAGRSEAQFRADVMRQDAVVRRIGIIGAAADRIIKADPDYAVSLPGVPLAEAKLMRNKIIQEYDVVDPGIVWDTARHDLLDLRTEVAAALAERQRNAEWVPGGALALPHDIPPDRRPEMLKRLRDAPDAVVLATLAATREALHRETESGPNVGRWSNALGEILDVMRARGLPDPVAPRRNGFENIGSGGGT